MFAGIPILLQRLTRTKYSTPLQNSKRWTSSKDADSPISSRQTRVVALKATRRADAVASSSQSQSVGQLWLLTPKEDPRCKRKNLKIRPAGLKISRLKGTKILTSLLTLTILWASIAPYLNQTSTKQELSVLTPPLVPPRKWLVPGITLQATNCSEILGMLTKTSALAKVTLELRW